MSGLYSFRELEPRDFAMLRMWLQTPEVWRWWGDPDTELALIKEDFTNPAMRQWIVSHDENPFAYAQSYEVHAWAQAHLASLHQGAMAIDAFIGVPEMVGIGHGAKFLRQLAERLLAEGVPLIAIDPALDNRRAQQASRKAGFRDCGRAETDSGSVNLMIFTHDTQHQFPGSTSS